MAEIPQDVLDQIDVALTKCVTTSIALSNTLDVPYKDDPSWTPWTRFAKPAADRAFAARKALRAALASPRTQETPEEDQ